MRISSLVWVVLAGAWPRAHAQVAEPSAADTRAPRLQAALDQWRSASEFAGATFACVAADGECIALATGLADRETNTPMKPTDRMLAGSVGKTFFGALALQLVAEDKLALDTLASAYLGSREWFARLPNRDAITVRMLMNHTSGLVRYELDPRFLAALTADPSRSWTPEEELAFVLDTDAPFAAGAGWEYSDTNYIVLGLVIESVTRTPCYESIRERFLEPFELRDTLPAVSREIPGLVQGYAGPRNPFGGKDAMLEHGRLAINPQFEWAGGGFASTSADVARWAKHLWGGDVLDAKRMEQALAGVDAPMLGAKYGLCVIVRDTPLGPSYGHDGFFPGYVTQMRWFPEHQLAAAVQVNTSVSGRLAKPLGAALVDFATIASRRH